MTVQSMHYDFKQKLNKVDSQRIRNLEVPEIDWKLNEAQEIFVKVIAEPRLANTISFEFSQRVIDDISIIVINQKKGAGLKPTLYDGDKYFVTTPTDYWFYAGSDLYATKDTCTARLDVREVKHADRASSSPFDKSSFQWREANIRRIADGYLIETEGDFVPTELCLNYLRQPRVIHNAGAWDPLGYTVDGITLTGTQDCELPPNLHREVVDLAVAITAGDLSLPDYEIKRSKLQMADKR
jgi:hypothetical protein